MRPPVAAAQQAIYGSSPSQPPEGACCASSPADNLRNVLAAAGLLEAALARSLVFRTKNMKSEKHVCFNSHVVVDATPRMPILA